MDRNELKIFAKNLINEAKNLVKDINVVNGDYESIIIYDEKWKLKPEFSYWDKKKIIESIFNKIKELDLDSQIYLFSEITIVEIASEKQIKPDGNLQSSAGINKKACVVLRNVRDKIEKEQEDRIKKERHKAYLDD